MNAPNCDLWKDDRLLDILIHNCEATLPATARASKADASRFAIDLNPVDFPLTILYVRHPANPGIALKERRSLCAPCSVVPYVISLYTFRTLSHGHFSVGRTRTPDP